MPAKTQTNLRNRRIMLIGTARSLRTAAVRETACLRNANKYRSIGNPARIEVLIERRREKEERRVTIDGTLMRIRHESVSEIAAAGRYVYVKSWKGERGADVKDAHAGWARGRH